MYWVFIPYTKTLIYKIYNKLIKTSDNRYYIYIYMYIIYRNTLHWYFVCDKDSRTACYINESPSYFRDVHVTRSLVLCVCFVDSCPFVLFLLAIVLSVLLRYADSDYLPLISSNSSCNKHVILMMHINKATRARFKYSMLFLFPNLIAIFV